MNEPTPNLIRRIGLFDSGVGGLSILKYLEEQAAASGIPVKFVYIADTARCPYGDRSEQEITRYVEQIVSFLDSSGVDRVVMACNTSAAVAASRAQEVSSAPVHDLITPSARYVAARYKRVGVIATSTTCKKQAFSRAIKNLNADCEVIEIPCPDLVPLVESGQLAGPVVDATIAKYVDQLKEFNVDALIFGCTHFPFLNDAFEKALPGVQLINPAEHLSTLLLGVREEKERIPRAVDFQKSVYFTTGSAESFANAAELCLKLQAGTLSESICAMGVDQLERVEMFDTNAPIPAPAIKEQRTQTHTVLLDNVLAPGQAPQGTAPTT